MRRRSAAAYRAATALHEPEARGPGSALHANAHLAGESLAAAAAGRTFGTARSAEALARYLSADGFPNAAQRALHTVSRPVPRCPGGPR